MKKLLIVQFRTDQSEHDEQHIFYQEYLSVEDHIEFHNGVTHEYPTDLSRYAGVIFGGSSQYMLGEGHGEGTWKQKAFAFLDALYQTDIPVFGICFGFQLMSLHQGAKIVTDKAMRETGTFTSFLTKDGREDAIFANMPDEFDLVFGHKETIVDFPDHMIPLSYSDRVACNGFRVKDKKIWGTLSHPELNYDRLAARLKLSPNYLEESTLDEVLGRFTDVPDAPTYLQNFLAQCRFE